MARKLKNPREKVMQRSIGFPMRQHLFFAKYPNFKPDVHCRRSVDDQIREMDPEFLQEANDEKKID